MKNSPKYNLESARWRPVVRSWRMEPSYGEAAEDPAKETESAATRSHPRKYRSSRVSM